MSQINAGLGEKPGISPGIVRYTLPTTIFASIKDLGVTVVPRGDCHIRANGRDGSRPGPGVGLYLGRDEGMVAPLYERVAPVEPGAAQLLLPL